MGRGIGSGRGGHTTGRGAKGQKARNTVRAHFEGGQPPYYKRIPHLRGFKSRATVLEVALSKINSWPTNIPVTPKLIISKFGRKSFHYDKVKVIDDGQKYHGGHIFEAVSFSRGAKTKVDSWNK